MLFMIITYGFNSVSGDYIAYEAAYNSESIQYMLSFKHYEPLYSILMACCKIAGLNFTGFRVFIAVLFVIVLYKGVRYYTEDTARVLALYLVFPFTYFVSVLRAGLASVVILYASRYLCDDKRENKRAYIIGVIIACMFHYSSLIFFFALLSKRRFKKTTFILLLLSSAILAYLYNYTNLIGSILSMLTGRSKTLAWANKTDIQVQLNGKGIFAFVFIILTGYLFIHYIYIVYRKQMTGESITKVNEIIFQHEKNEIDFSYGLYYLSIFLVPFALINPTWLRVIWEMLIFLFIAFSHLMNLYRREKLIEKGTTALDIILLASWLVVLYLFASGFPSGEDMIEYLQYFGQNNLVFSML